MVRGRHHLRGSDFACTQLAPHVDYSGSLYVEDTWTDDQRDKFIALLDVATAIYHDSSGTFLGGSGDHGEVFGQLGLITADYSIRSFSKKKNLEFSRGGSRCQS